MATSYTDLLRLAKPANGDLSWGDTVNNNLTEMLEDAIANTAQQDVTGGNWTLSTANGTIDNQRMAILIATGSPGVTRYIVAPALSKSFLVINRSNASIVVNTTAAANANATLAAGEKAIIYYDTSASGYYTVSKYIDTSLYALLASPTFTGTVTAPTLTSTNATITTLDGVTSINGGQLGGLRNKIINGAMMIDQRNGGASITNAGYPVDRFKIQYASGTLTAQRSVSIVPSGFSYSLGVTVTAAGTRLATDYPSISQRIEGYNLSEMGFGTANASAFTLSFWVRSSLTGTFGGTFSSGDNNRCYGFTYTISNANTWEYKTITVAGDISGGATAYPTDNNTGLYVNFDLGVGANYQGTVGSWSAQTNRVGVSSSVSLAQTLGATFYLAGVQLEKGTVATAFEQRPVGVELALCQRYYETGRIFQQTTGGNYLGFGYPFHVAKRAVPTVIWTDNAGNTNKFSMAAVNNFSTIGGSVAGEVNQVVVDLVAAANTTANTWWSINFTASAEL